MDSGNNNSKYSSTNQSQNNPLSSIQKDESPTQLQNESLNKINETNNKMNVVESEKFAPLMNDQFSEEDKTIIGSFEKKKVREVILGPSLAESIPHMCKCLNENEYYLYEYDPSEFNKQGDKLLYCKDSSTFCQKNFTYSFCKQIHLDIKKFSKNEEDYDYADYLHAEKSECCSDVSVYNMENGQNKQIGRIEYKLNSNKRCGCSSDPYYSWYIYESNPSEEIGGNPSYKICAEMCQYSFWCACPVEECREIEFGIFDGNTKTNEKRQREGKIIKFNQGFKKDTYNEECVIITFPNECSLIQKELILVACLYINLCFFYESDHRLELEEINNE